MGNDIVKEELVTVFLSLLRDNEAEVRTAIATQVPGFGVLVGNQDVILKEFMPCIKALISDSSQHVRGSLATHVSGLAPLLGKEQ